MRIVYVTGGYNGYAEGTLTDTTGGNLSGVTIKAALIPTNTSTPPPADDAVWRTPTVTRPTPSTVTVHLPIGDDTPSGDYYLWADITDNPNQQPIAASNDRVRVV